MTDKYCGVLRWLYDWQTLITGFLALAAAYVAARPIWQQLRLSARDTLTGRVAAMESRRSRTRELTREVTGAFLHQLGVFDDGELGEVKMGWAFSAQQCVDAVIDALTEHQETSLDGERVNDKRDAAIQACKRLSNCLSDIHVPDSIDFSGFEEPPEEERAPAIERATRAKADLCESISAVSAAANDLDRAFLTKMGELREQIRSADRILIPDN